MYGVVFQELLCDALDALLLDYDRARIVELVMVSKRAAQAAEKKAEKKAAQHGGRKQQKQQNDDDASQDSDGYPDSDDDYQESDEDDDRDKDLPYLLAESAFPGVLEHLRRVQAWRAVGSELYFDEDFDVDEELGTDFGQTHMSGGGANILGKIGQTLMKKGLGKMGAAAGIKSAAKVVTGMFQRSDDEKMRDAAVGEVLIGAAKSRTQLKMLACVYGSFVDVKYDPAQRSVTVKEPKGIDLQNMMKEAQLMMTQRLTPSFRWDMKVTATQRMRDGIVAYVVDLEKRRKAAEDAEAAAEAKNKNKQVKDEKEQSEKEKKEAALNPKPRKRPALFSAHEFLRCAAVRCVERFTVWLSGPPQQRLFAQLDKLHPLTLQILAHIKDPEVYGKRKNAYLSSQKLRKTCLGVMIAHARSRALMIYCQRLAARLETLLFKVVGIERGTHMLDRLGAIHMKGDAKASVEIMKGPISEGARKTLAYAISLAPPIPGAFASGGKLYWTTATELTKVLLTALVAAAPPPPKDPLEEMGGLMGVVDKAVAAQMEGFKKLHVRLEHQETESAMARLDSAQAAHQGMAGGATRW